MLLCLKRVNASDNPQPLCEWVDYLTGNLGAIHGELLFSDGRRLTSLPGPGIVLDYREEGYVPGWWLFVDVGGEEHERSIENWFNGQKGCGYDYVGLLRFVLEDIGKQIPWLGRLCKWLHLDILFPIVSGTRFWCTESSETGLNIAGVYCVKRWQVSPNDYAGVFEDRLVGIIPAKYANVIRQVNWNYARKYGVYCNG